MTNLDRVLKSRDITLPRKVCLVKAMVFPEVTYGCESWTINKAVTNPNSVFKCRNIILLTKVHIVKAVVFPVVMYGCESCIIKKPEHKRIDAFELCCWRRPLRVRFCCKEVKTVNPEGNQS